MCGKVVARGQSSGSSQASIAPVRPSFVPRRNRPSGAPRFSINLITSVCLYRFVRLTPASLATAEMVTAFSWRASLKAANIAFSGTLSFEASGFGPAFNGGACGGTLRPCHLAICRKSNPDAVSTYGEIAAES